MTKQLDDLICVGAIAGAYGVRGEVRLKSYTSDPLSILDFAPLTTQDGKSQFDIVITGQIKNGLSARMSGITNKEQADALKGTNLYAPKSKLPELPDDEYYHSDLVGLAVYDTGGQRIGTVKAVHNHGASDLLEITAPTMETSALLPFTKAAVPTVDIATGRIIADPPVGIFPED